MPSNATAPLPAPKRGPALRSTVDLLAVEPAHLLRRNRRRLSPAYPGPDLIEQLATVRVGGRVEERRGPSGTMRLRRAWPGPSRRLDLEYVTEGGRVVTAQWTPTARDRRSSFARARTAQASRPLVRSVRGGVLLVYGAGTDPSLPGLRELLARGDARIVKHKPGSRATVRLGGGEAQLFAKALRPARLEAIRKQYELGSTLAGQSFRTPEVVELDRELGILITSEVRGVPMTRALGTRAAGAALRALAGSVRMLHAAAPDPSLRTHTGTHEARSIRLRIGEARRFLPSMTDEIGRVGEPIVEALRALESRSTPVHRDLNPGNALYDADTGAVGLVDLGTLALGDSALDLGSLLGSLVVENARQPHQAREAFTHFADVYEPAQAELDRAYVYLRCKLLKAALGCVFRPARRALIPTFLELAAAPSSRFFP